MAVHEIGTVAAEEAETQKFTTFGDFNSRMLMVMIRMVKAGSICRHENSALADVVSGTFPFESART